MKFGRRRANDALSLEDGYQFVWDDAWFADDLDVPSADFNVGRPRQAGDQWISLFGKAEDIVVDDTSADAIASAAAVALIGRYVEVAVNLRRQWAGLTDEVRGVGDLVPLVAADQPAGNVVEPEACETQQRDGCLLYTSPSPRDRTRSRMPSSA